MAERTDTVRNRPPRPGIPGRPGPFGRGGPRHGMPVEKPRDFRGTMGRLWGYFGRERRRLAVIFTLVTFSSLTGLAGPYLLGRTIDRLTGGPGTVDLHRVGLLVLALLAVYAVGAGLMFCQQYLMAGVSQRIVRQVRADLFGRLQELPVAFFDARTHGEVMSRFTNDVENVSATISQATMQLMSGTLTLVGALVMMLILSPLLTLASMVTIPLVLVFITFITRRTQPLFRRQQAVLGRLNGHIEETMSGWAVVQAFNRADRAVAEFEEQNTALREVGMRAQIWSGFIMPLLNVINNLGFGVVAGVGGILAVRGMTTVGVVASFLGYARQFTRPLNELSGIYNQLQSAVAGAERIFEVLDETPEPPDAPDAVDPGRPDGHVEFQDVSFGYRPDVPVLSGISFNAPAGSTTALVGPTGAGKTTVVNLLTRFYDVTGGRILLDGRDIREYTRAGLQRGFGVVLQDACLFSGTIRENIRYGRLEATDAEVEEAARTARADRFIRRLPEGYDTVLTENGGALSHGERQLLTIARAVLADPAILILDEATSSVDTRTEVHIQEAMHTLMRGRTSFIIAHRLSTIRNADTILVIDHGRIVEQGHHADLVRRPGTYHDMYYGQFANVSLPGEPSADT